MDEPCYMVVPLEWDYMAAMPAALESEAANRAAEDAMKHLRRLTTSPAMLLELEELRPPSCQSPHAPPRLRTRPAYTLGW